MYGFLDLVKLLIEKKQNVNQRDNFGNTSLILGYFSFKS